MMDCDASSQMKFVAVAVVALLHGLNLPSSLSLFPSLPISSSTPSLCRCLSFSGAHKRETCFTSFPSLLFVSLSVCLSLSKEGWTLNGRNQLQFLHRAKRYKNSRLFFNFFCSLFVDYFSHLFFFSSPVVFSF